MKNNELTMVKVYKGVQNQELVLKADYDKLAAKLEMISALMDVAKKANEHAKSGVTALQAENDKLAAECALLNKFISESCYAYDGDGCDVCDSYVNAEESIWFPKTPATNAAIAEWKARGVEEFVSELSVKLRLAGGEDGRSLVYYGEYADHMESKGEDFAAKLRAGVKG